MEEDEKDDINLDVSLASLGSPGIDSVTDADNAQKKEEEFPDVSLSDLSKSDSKVSPSGVQTTLVGFDPKEYSDYLQGVYYNEALDISRAKAQGWFEQVSRGAGRIVLGGTVDIAKNLSAIIDVEGYDIGEGEVPGTELTRSLTEFSKYINEDLLKIYRENPNQSWDVGDVGWWTDNGSSILSSAVSFLGTGYITGFGLGRVAQFMRYVGTGKRGMSLFGNATTVANAAMLNQAEGMGDAIEVYDQIYKSYMDSGVGEEASRLKASAGAAHVINTNRLNIGLNLTSAKMFTKLPSLASRQFKRNYGMMIGRESGQEYLEEIVNYGARERGLGVGRGEEISVGNALTDAFFSKEGAEAGFFGAIGGAVQTGGSILLDADGARKGQARQEAYIRQLDTDRSNMKTLSMYGVGNNINNSKDLINEMNEAYSNIINAQDQGERVDPNDMAKYQRARTELLASQSYSAFSAGAGKQLRSYYEAIIAEQDSSKIAKDIPEGMLLEDDNRLNYKKQAEDALSKIKQYEETFDSLSDTQHDRQQAYMTKVGDIFMQDQIKELNLYRAELQKKISGVVDVYNEANGSSISASINNIEQLKKDAPELYEQLEQAGIIEEINGINDAKKTVSEMRLKLIAKYEEITSLDYQLNRDKEKKAGIKTEEELQQILATALIDENTTPERISKALDEYVNKKGVTEENKAKFTAEADRVIAILKDKNRETHEATPHSPVSDEENDPLTDNAKPDEEFDISSLSPDQIIQRETLIANYEAIASDIDSTDAQKDSAVNAILNSGLFGTEEARNFSSQLENFKQQTKSNEELEIALITEMRALLDTPGSSRAEVDAVTKKILDSDIFEDNELEQLIKEIDVYFKKEDNAPPSATADEFSDMFGEPSETPASLALKEGDVYEREGIRYTYKISPVADIGEYFQGNDGQAYDVNYIRDQIESGEATLVTKEQIAAEEAEEKKREETAKNEVRNTGETTEEQIDTIVENETEGLSAKDKANVKRATVDKDGKLVSDEKAASVVDALLKAGGKTVDAVVAAIKSIRNRIKALMISILMITGLAGGVYTAQNIEMAKYFAGKEGLMQVDEAIIIANDETNLNTMVLTSLDQVIPDIATGFEIISEVPDHVSGRNTLISYRSQWDNERGFEYIITPNKQHRGGQTFEYENVEGVGHFFIDTDLRGENATLRVNYVDNPDTFFPVFILNLSEEKGDLVTLNYRTGAEIVREDSSFLGTDHYMIPTPLLQWKVSEINWGASGRAHGFKSTVSEVKTKDDKPTGILFKQEDAYSRFSGNSVVFLFKDEFGRTVVRDFAGSFNQITGEIASIMDAYNISEDELIIGRYDAGSFSAKPAPNADGTLSTDQWDDYNPTDGGAALIIPNQGDQDTSIPLEAGSIITSLLLMIRRNNKKGFITKFKQYYPGQDPEAAYILFSKKIKEEDALATNKTKQVNPTDNLRKAMSDKNRPTEQIRKDEAKVEIDGFIMAKSFPEQLRKLLEAQQREGEAFHQILGVGFLQDRDGKNTGYLTLRVKGNHAYLYAAESLAEFSTYAPVDNFPLQELFDRAKTGLLLDREGKEKAIFTIDLIKSDKAAREQLIANGIDPASFKSAMDENVDLTDTTLSDQEKEEKQAAEDKANALSESFNVTEDQSDETPIVNNLEIKTDDTTAEGQDIRERNKRNTGHLPKNWGGNIIGKRSAKPDAKTGKYYFEPLYDKYGNPVEALYVEGNTVSKSFDQLFYPRNPKSPETNDNFFILGDKNSKSYYKSKNIEKTSGVYYMKDRGPEAPQVKTASEIFAIDNNGALLINTPMVKIGDRVHLVYDPTWKWLVNNTETMLPILIYRDQDVTNGKPKEGAKPLDMFTTGENTPNEATKQIRKEFTEAPAGMYSKPYFIKHKSGGYHYKSRTGDANLGSHRLRENPNIYQKSGDTWVLQDVDKMKNKFPIVLIKGGDGGFTKSLDKDLQLAGLSSEDKATLAASEFYLRKASKNVKDKGAPVILFPTANGKFMYSKAFQRRLNDQEISYVLANLPGLLYAEMSERIKRQENDKSNVYRKNFNFIDGLSQVLPMHYITSEEKTLASEMEGDNSYDSLYKEGSININNYNIIIRDEKGSYKEVSFFPIPIGDKKVGFPPSALGLLLGGELASIEHYYDEKFDASTRELWDATYKSVYPSYKQMNGKGQYTDRGNTTVLPGEKIVYMGMAKVVADELRNVLINTIKGMRRNVFVGDGSESVLNNENSKNLKKYRFTDPVTGSEYQSVMHWLDQGEVLRHDVRPSGPINGANIYIDTIEGDFDEAFKNNAKEREQENKEEFELVREKARDVKDEKENTAESVINTGKASKPVNIDQMLEAIEDADERSSIEETIEGLDRTDPDIIEMIKEMIDESTSRKRYRKVTGDNTASGMDIISDYEYKWMMDNFGNRTAVKMLDRVAFQGQSVLGVYHKAMATIARFGTEGTAYHEAFHIVFDLSLSTKDKRAVLKEAAKRYTGKDIELLLNVDNLSDQQIADIRLEEFMADDFMAYMLRKENGEIKERSRIQKLFDTLIFYIKKILPIRPTIESMFRNIAEGRYNSGIKMKNSWDRVVPMYSQIMSPSDQRYAMRYIKGIMRKNVYRFNDSNQYGADNFFDWIKGWTKGINNAELFFNTIAEYDHKDPSNPKLIKGRIFKDLAKVNAEIKNKTITKERLRFKKVLLGISKPENWFNHKANDTFKNPRSGFKALTIQLFNAAGIPMRLSDDDYLGSATYKSVAGRENIEEEDMFNDDISETSKQYKHDTAAHFVDRKATIDDRLKSWMFLTPVYEFHKKGDNKGQVVINPRNNEKQIAIDPISKSEISINFGRVYKKIQSNMQGKDFSEMKKIISDMALIDNEVASVWESIKSLESDSSNIYSSFFVHFHMDRRSMMTIINNNGEYDVINTNRQAYKRAIINTWSNNASFMTSANNKFDVVNQAVIAPVLKEMLAFEQWWKLQLSSENANRLESDTGQNAFLIIASKKANSIFTKIGIEIDQVIWDNHIENGYLAAKNIFEDILFSHKTTNADGSVSSNQYQSLQGLILKLSEGVNVYRTEKTTLNKIAEFVARNNLDAGSDSFMDIKGKMVFGINLNHYASLTFNAFKSDRWQEKIDYFKQDDFYAENLWLQELAQEDYRTRLDLKTLDGIRDKYRDSGKDYSSSSIGESIQTRLAAYLHAPSSKYTIINNGTKADKGQSLYNTVPRLGKIDKDKSYLDIAKEVMWNTYLQEQRRIRKVQAWRKDEKFMSDYGVKNLNENGIKFMYIPSLNDVTDMDLISDASNIEAFPANSEALAQRDELVKQHIDDLLEQIYQSGMDVLVDNDIIGTEGDAYVRNFNTPKNIGNISETLREYLYNEFIWNLEQSKVMMGDLAQYSGDLNYLKRGYQVITPGASPYVSDGIVGNESISAIVMNDVYKNQSDNDMMGIITAPVKEAGKGKLKTFAENMIKAKARNPESNLDPTLATTEDEKIILDTVNKYYRINKTDGFSVMNMEAAKLLMTKTKKWDSSYQHMYDKFWKNDAEIFKIMEEEGRTKLTKTEINEIKNGPKLEPHKPFGYGERFSPVHNKILNEQYKNSIFVVTRLMADGFAPDSKGTNYSDMYKLLTGEDNRAKWENKSERIVFFDSAVKVGLYGSKDIDTEDDFVTRDVLLRNIRYPQDINSHDRLLMNNGTQQSKLIEGNIEDGDINFYLQSIGMSFMGSQIKQMFNNAWTKKIRMSSDALAERLGLNQAMTIPANTDKFIKFMENLRDILREHNIDREMPDDYNEALDLVESDLTAVKFNIPLDFPSMGLKYQNIVGTLFRRGVLTQKVKGDSLAQISDYGTQTSNELKFLRREDGKIRGAQIGLSARFVRDVLGFDIELGNIADMDLSSSQKEALKMIGYRIPTQGKSSMLPMEVAHIFDDSIGSTIMVPAEISVQQGSDYDIDKMFIMMRNLDSDGNVLPYENPLIADSDNNNKQLENLIFDITWAVLTNDKFIKETLSSLDTKSFEDLKEFRYDKIQSKDPSKVVYEKNTIQNVSSFHTNIWSETLNKFAKAAVGIIANATTAQAYYKRMGVHIKVIEKDGVVQNRDAIFIKTTKKTTPQRTFVKINEDGELISDILKEFGSAALDNANDPLLGYLDINSMTLNSALLLANLGYSKTVIFDFMKQPIIKKLSKFYGNFGSNNLNDMLNIFLSSEKNVPDSFSKIYVNLREDLGKNNKVAKVKSSVLKGYIGLELNSKSSVNMKRDQAAILLSFINMFYKGNSLATLNKMISPEKNSKLNGYAQHYAFQNLYHGASNNLAYKSDFRDNPNDANVGRIAAFYEVLDKYRDLTKKLFATNTPAYKSMRSYMTSLTSSKATVPGDSNTMTSMINYMLFTKNVDAFKSLIVSKSNLHNMFFGEGNSLPDILDKIKKIKKFQEIPLIANIESSDVTSGLWGRRVFFNNTTNRDPEEKNEIQSSWQELLSYRNDPDSEYKMLGEFAHTFALYSIIASGLDKNFNTPHEYIPQEFWTEQNKDYLNYWERLSNSLIDNNHTLTEEDIINTGEQYARSHPNAIQSIPIPIDKQGNLTGKKAPGYATLVGDAVFRLDRSTPNGGDLSTHSTIILNREAYKAKNKGKFMPFIKYYKTVYNTGDSGVSRGLSGYRLLGLVDIVHDSKTDEVIHAKYKEVQWLGSFGYNETDMSIENPSSNHPINANVPSVPSEGYYWNSDKNGVKEYKEHFGINPNFRTVKEDNEELSPAKSDDNVGEENNTTDGYLPESENTQGLADKGNQYASLASMQVQREPSNLVKDKISRFLNGIGASTQVVGAMEERGIQIAAVMDIANMTISVANEESQWKDIPEEASHFYVEGLQNHKEVARLIQRAKEDPLYEKVVEDYGKLYNYDENRLAKETAAKLIARSLLKGQPESKNFIRRLIESVRRLIVRLFKNRDPFNYAAQVILSEATPNLDFTNAAYSKMYSAITDQVNRVGIDEEQEMDIDLSKASEHNVKRYEKFIDKLQQGIRKKLSQLKYQKGEGVRILEAELVKLQDEISLDQGFDFIDKYRKRAYGQLFRAKKDLQRIMDNEDSAPLNKLRELDSYVRDRLGTYEYVKDLASILSDMYREQGLTIPSMRIAQLAGIAGQIDNVYKNIDEAHKRIVTEKFESISSTGESYQTIYDNLSETLKEVGWTDGLFLSLTDTNDPLVGKMGLALRMAIKQGRDNFADYFRGKGKTKGAARATQEYISSAGTNNNRDLYEKFTNYDAEQDQYTFITEEEAELLGAEEYEFYKVTFLPYIEKRQELIERGQAGTIKNAHNIPGITMKGFEAGLTMKRGKIELQSGKDMFREVEGQDEFRYAKVDEKGTIVPVIPFRYNVPVPSDRISFDLADTVSTAMENILHSEQMLEIEPLHKAFSRILEAQEFVEHTEIDGQKRSIIKPRAVNKAFEKYKPIGDALLYGDQEAAKKFAGIDTRKVSKQVRKAVSYTNLALNLPAIVMNPLVMGYFSFMKAVGGQDYTLTDWVKASFIAIKNMFGMMNDATLSAKNPTNRETLLMERLEVFSHGLRDMNLSSRMNVFKNFFTKLGYGGFKAGSAMIQPTTAIAFMLHQKIKLKSGKEITMHDAYEKHGDNIQVRDDVIEAIGEQAFAKLELQAKEVVRKISDNSGMSDMSAMSTTWWGKFVLIHRGWMVPMYNNMWGAAMYNNISGMPEAGIWRSQWHMLRHGLKKGNMNQLWNLVNTGTTAKIGDFDPIMGGEFTEESLKMYKSNSRQFMMHLVTIATLAVLSGLNDDDVPEGDAGKFFMLMRVRFAAEISSMIWYEDTYRILRQPTVAFSYLERLLSAADYMTLSFGEGSEVLQSGRYKGQTKRIASLKRLLPIGNAIDKFEDIDSMIKFYSKGK